MFKYLKGWWLKIRAWLDWARGRSPYGHLPRDTIRILGPDGVAMGDSVGALAYVSRHGLRASGVTCPCCGFLAVRADDWAKVVQTSWGEAVFCSCGRMLLASPDDDIDPVTPKQWYDPGIYHRFARPAAWEAPRQRTLTRPPLPNEWVVIFDYKHPINGVEHDLDGAEGRAIAVTPLEVCVALSDGIAGSTLGAQHVVVPLDRVHVMIFDTLRKGDRVNILRGTAAGSSAVVVAFKAGEIEVLSGKTLLSVPVERLEKIHEPLPA